MRIYTEFIVVYEEQALPSEETFCPSFWTAEDFDAEGNYYFNDTKGLWTELAITRKEAGKPESTLTVYTHRPGSIFQSSLLEVQDLGRYLGYLQDGRYEDSPADGIAKPVLTALAIDALSAEDYREFLDTVHQFLATTGGAILNYPEVLDADAFRASFLHRN